ncbi:sialidase family protein [Ideonella sp. A 288]|uniref:WD40/YVTN/BNR-like repeat-containing protein n=1 Tax=Ideonella sp. A 288 TaxID=1962181 RepID=UPI000B4BB204|nr:sialidase family protein [Ideonella sp. A 288]
MPRRAWVATRKGLIELHRAPGQAWQIVRTSFLGDPVSMVLPPQPDGPHRGRMLAALNLGHFGVKLHASDDEGLSWTEVAAPTYPPQPEGAAGPPWKLVLVWALEAASGAVWAGTLPGGLFRSADFGRSWQLVDSLWQRPERLEWFGGGYDVPGIHSICPHPQRAGELLIGISCGGAWTTRDDGATWALTAQGMRATFMPPERVEDGNIQDPHCIARCAAAPEVLWCQHHNGIWRSVDAGASWQEVTSAPKSSFGFTVAVHPHDPDTAWFVPAVADQQRVPVDGALVVHRTRDGGRSFEVLRAGLPSEHCYDLVYRHGLAVGHDGRTMMMGSTTGNLWSSSDGGEHWHTVSQTLPQIYTVRFG